MGIKLIPEMFNKLAEQTLWSKIVQQITLQLSSGSPENTYCLVSNMVVAFQRSHDKHQSCLYIHQYR